jgi:hypothetical protein
MSESAPVADPGPAETEGAGHGLARMSKGTVALHALESTVRTRDGGQCVLCAAAGTTVHCLFDPRLWDDGVGPADNAVLLCDEHQRHAARDDIPLERLREAAGLAPCRQG